MAEIDNEGSVHTVQLGDQRPSRGRGLSALVLWLGLPLVLFFSLCGILLHVAASRLLAPLQAFAIIDHDSVSFHLNGVVEFHGLTFTPLSQASGIDDELTIANLKIRTPGMLWLARSLFADRTVDPSSWRASLQPAVPGFAALDSLTIEARGVSSTGEPFMPLLPWWLGLTAAAPFDAAGCGLRRHWSEADLSGMHLPDEPNRMTLTLTPVGEQAMAINGDISHDGGSRFEFEFKLGLDQPSRLLDTSWSAMQLVSMDWKVTDDGFILRRNSLCASRSKMSRREFVNRHLVAIQRRMLIFGAVAPEELQDTYRTYAEEGGELSFSAHPAKPLALADWFKAPPADRVAALNASLKHKSSAATPFALTFIDPINAASALPTLVASTTGNSGAAPADTPAAGTATDGSGSAATAQVPTAAPSKPTAPVPASGSASSKPLAASGPNPTASAAKPSTTQSARPVQPVAAAPIRPTTVPDIAALTPVPSTTAVPAPSVPETTGGDPSTDMTQGIPTSYRALEKAIGRQVRVRTIYNTVRVGRLTNFNRAAIEIEVLESGKTMTLSLPRQTLRSAEILDDYRG